MDSNGMKETKSKTMIVVGCGQRGQVYASYSLKFPEKLRVIGFADPRPHAIKNLLEIYRQTVDENLVFTDWKRFIDLGRRVADCVVITLPDNLHKHAATEFTRLGYHMLLEKPMATLLEDCWAITLTCRQHPQQINAVCHGLRYYLPSLKLKQLIESGLIGDVININHVDPVGFYHFAHSFVRGNWHRESESSFSLLTKCCHDIDAIVYWMGDKKKCVKKIGSINKLGNICKRKENEPLNATNNCLTCPVEENCCYSAKKIYLNPMQKTNDWPSSIVLSAEIANIQTSKDIEDLFTTKVSESERRELLEKCLAHPKTNYGRCVYDMDNDVCDNQVVCMQFDDGSTATMTMIATARDKCLRKTKIFGSKGQLDWDDARQGKQIEHFDFLSNQTNLIDYSDTIPALGEINANIRTSDLRGSNFYLIDNFVQALVNEDKSYVLTDVEESFRSHVIVFAAEYSRRHNCVVDMNEFYRINQIKL